MVIGRIRAALRRPPPAGLVLLYHRVAPCASDPQLLAVAPERFDAQLARLNRIADVMPLRDLVDRAQRGRLPRRAIAITFDDGYVDNLLHAKPILGRHRLHATVFACSVICDEQQEYWWDTLDRALLRHAGSANLELPLGTTSMRLLVDGDPLAHPRWSVLSAETPTSRHAAYRRLAGELKGLAPDARAATLAALLQQLGLDTAPAADARPLDRAELRALARGDTIEVGAHGRTHPQLSSLPPDAQREQVAGSRADLETWLERPVRCFAYPYGTKADYDDVSVAAVEAAGFECACSNFPGLLRNREAPRFEVPRMLVRDWSADDFTARVNAALGGA